MDNYETDIRSYERRIQEHERYAMGYLSEGNYEKLLTTAGRLMALKEAMNEVYYQMSNGGQDEQREG